MKTLDLSADLDRIRRHIPCLERAAVEAASPCERVIAGLELAAWRLAEELAEHDRAISNDAEQHRTEEKP